MEDVKEQVTAEPEPGWVWTAAYIFGVVGPLVSLFAFSFADGWYACGVIGVLGVVAGVTVDHAYRLWRRWFWG